VRIGGPARKHDVTDVDIWHAVPNAIRRVIMGDDLTMLIGPASDGALLEIGVLDIDRGRPGRHPCHATTTEVLQAPRVR